jgi:hypothetical protein
MFSNLSSHCKVLRSCSLLSNLEALSLLQGKSLAYVVTALVTKEKKGETV